MLFTCPVALQDSPKERLGAAQNSADTSQLSSLSNTPHLWWAPTHFKQGHRSSAFPGLPDGKGAAPCHIPVLSSRTQGSPTTPDTLHACSIQNPTQKSHCLVGICFQSGISANPLKEGNSPLWRRDSPQHGLVQAAVLPSRLSTVLMQKRQIFGVQEGRGSTLTPRRDLANLVS